MKLARIARLRVVDCQAKMNGKKPRAAATDASFLGATMSIAIEPIGATSKTKDPAPEGRPANLSSSAAIRGAQVPSACSIWRATSGDGWRTNTIGIHRAGSCAEVRAVVISLNHEPPIAMRGILTTAMATSDFVV